MEFQRGIEKLKDTISRQSDKLEREKEAAILAARVEAQVAALQPESNSDSTLQPALDNENHKKVTLLTFLQLMGKIRIGVYTFYLNFMFY